MLRKLGSAGNGEGPGWRGAVVRCDWCVTGAEMWEGNKVQFLCSASGPVGDRGWRVRELSSEGVRVRYQVVIED